MQFGPEDHQGASSPASARDPAAALEKQRELARRDFLRANTAVAAIFGLVLVLALASVLATVSAVRNRDRAESAERASREQLWRSQLEQARATRLSGQSGRRTQGLSVVRRAAAVRASTDLRNEAIACLALSDIENESFLGKVPSVEDWGDVAPGLGMHAIGTSRGACTVYRSSDGSSVCRLDIGELEPKPAGVRDRRVLHRAWSRDGRRFAMDLRDGTIAVWELPSGRLVWSNVPRVARPSGMGFSPDGARLGFFDHDGSDTLRIVDLASGLDVPHRVRWKGYCCAFRPGGDVLSVGEEKEVRLVRIADGEVLKTVQVPDVVTEMVWSADGTRLAATSRGHEIFLWDFAQDQLHVLRGHSEVIRTLAFSPDGSRLMSASNDNVTRIWECSLGYEELRILEGVGLAWGQDGKRIGFSRGKFMLGIWNLAEEDVFRLEGNRGGRGYDLLQTDLTRDGRFLAALQPGGIELRDFNAGPGGRRFVRVDGIRCFAWRSDGGALLVGRDAGLAWRKLVRAEPGDFETSQMDWLAYEQAPDLWDTGSMGAPNLGKAEPVSVPFGLSVRHVALCADDRTALADLSDGRLAVLDLGGERSPVFMKLRQNMVYYLGPSTRTGSGRIAISPDGAWVALGYGTAREGSIVFDAKTGEVVVRFEGGTSTVAFSPDGRYLALGGGGSYRLYRTGEWKSVWESAASGVVGQWGCMAFLNGGNWIALTTRRQVVELFDTGSGTPLATLVAPEPQSLSGLRASLDGARLVAPTHNNLLQVWDLPPLKKRLARLGLDWGGEPGAGERVLEPEGHSGGWLNLATASVVGIGAAGVAGFLAVLVLRRHRRLAGEFVGSQERLLSQHRELEVEREVGRLKSNFVSTVSHEFRTPLSVIMSSAELVHTYHDRLSEARKAKHMTDILGATRRMKELIDEVLLLGKVESGTMEFRPRLLDVRLFCERVVDQVSTATGGRCPIGIELLGGVTEAPLDENLVTLILTNLLTNAVKYSAPGSPVRIVVNRSDTELAIDVRDRGIGIPAVDQAGLFRTFHRGGNVGQTPGTGLGLAIVRRCAEMHGGTVVFSSVPGEGSTFGLRLPVGRQAESGAAQACRAGPG